MGTNRAVGIRETRRAEVIRKTVTGKENQRIRKRRRESESGIY